MTQQASNPEEAITLPRAVRESKGLVTYMQLWSLVKKGEVEASQPGGKFRHHRIRRSELERIIAPVAPGDKK